MLTDRQIDNRVVRYISLQEQINQLKAEAEKLQNELKQEMINRDSEVLKTTKHCVKWTFCKRDNFDSKSFINDHPSLAESYIRSSEYRRFSIK